MVGKSRRIREATLKQEISSQHYICSATETYLSFRGKRINSIVERSRRNREVMLQREISTNCICPATEAYLLSREEKKYRPILVFQKYP